MNAEQRNQVVAERLYRNMNEKRALRNRLEIKHAIPHMHEKAQRLFELAWEYGHSSGESDVESYYDELVELIVR